MQSESDFPNTSMPSPAPQEAQAAQEQSESDFPNTSMPSPAPQEAQAAQEQSPPIGAPAPPPSAVEDAHQARAAALRGELDAAQKPGEAQVVRLRAMGDSQRIGLVINKAGSKEYIARRLEARHMRDVTLEPGDQLLVVNLVGQELEEYLWVTGMAPAVDEEVRP